MRCSYLGRDTYTSGGSLIPMLLALIGCCNRNVGVKCGDIKKKPCGGGTPRAMTTAIRGGRGADSLQQFLGFFSRD